MCNAATAAERGDTATEREKETERVPNAEHTWHRFVGQCSVWVQSTTEGGGKGTRGEGNLQRTRAVDVARVE